jgi:predicted acyl esterase
MEHPAYDAYWQAYAVDKLLVERPSTVPTLWTQGYWDQEDNWGANHAWRALKAAGHEANNYLVLGPLQWHADTAQQYHDEILFPVLDEHLRGAPPANLARVTAYNTGEKRWERLAGWPTLCEEQDLQALYTGAGFSLSFERPTEAEGGDTYCSDPAKPVPYLPMPVIDPFAISKASRSWIGASISSPATVT